MTTTKPIDLDPFLIASMPHEEIPAIFFVMMLLTYVLEDADPRAFAETIKAREMTDDLRGLFAQIEREPDLQARLTEIVGSRDQEALASFVDEVRERLIARGS